MTVDVEQSINDSEALRRQIDHLQSEQQRLVDEVRRTLKRLQVPWSRIPNAPIDDSVMLSRRLIKLYHVVQDMSEEDALDAIQSQINFRTINMVVGGSKQTGEHPPAPPEI